MLELDRVSLPESSESLRHEVRGFLEEHRDLVGEPNSDFTTGYSPEFSRALGKRGWIGMTWPKAFGGGDRTFFDRYVITEELLAAGAPVSAHWIADRQSGPLLLRFGGEKQKQTYLPPITRGESFFSIGMSEPNTGSDLASVRTAAKKVDGGWVINGSKIWTTDAHRNHFLIALVRTSPAQGENRHVGLSQIVVDLRNDGAKVRPIRNMAGGEDFNEIVFEDVLVPEDRIVGEPGNGWKQVTSELSYERSGPERFLSAFRVLVEFVRLVGPNPLPHEAAVIGRASAHLMTLRKMSASVAGMLNEGKQVDVEASLVKELGNNFEKLLPEMTRLATSSARGAGTAWRSAYEQTQLLSPSFTLRGGTREILRGVIARGLGLR